MSLKRYQLIAELGRGGNADVFLAVARGPRGFKKLQVVKYLRERDEDYVESFLDEGRLGARLNHPNIVQTNEVGKEGSDHFIVMEFLDGQPLQQLIKPSRKEPPLPLSLHLRVLCDVLDGLQYAHTLDDFDGRPLHIIHRDVSPHNVFVTYDGVTKLLDFGIADSAVRLAQTLSGMLKGKIVYMSPEQAAGKREVDARSDLFSVGVMLFQAATGTRMWGDVPDLEVIRRLTHDEIPKVRERNPNAPAWLAAVCDRALSFHADARYTTAAELQAALEDGMDSHGLKTTSKELAQFVTTRFKAEREHIRQAIEQCIKSADDDDTDVDSLPNLRESMIVAFGPDAVEEPSSPSVSSSLSPSARRLQKKPSEAKVVRVASVAPPAPRALLDERGNTYTGQEAELARPPPTASRMRAWWTIGFSALFIVTALVIWMRWTSPAPTPTPASSSAPVTALSSSPSPVGSTSSSPLPAGTAVGLDAAPTMPRKIELRVSVTPAQARLFLDDGLIKNPAAMTIVSDTMKHQLRAEAPGYRTQTLDVTFDRDLTTVVALEKIEGGAPMATAAK